MCEISQTVLRSWDRVGTLQTQEIRSLLDQELEMISQKACGLVNQTIEKILPDCGMSLGALGDMDVDSGTLGASSGKRCVSVLQYSGWTDTDRVARSCSLAVSSWGMKVSVENYKNPLLRKLE
jgi:hypothetical protein